MARLCLLFAIVFLGLSTAKKHHIILILTDDQDLTLGGLEPMKQAVEMIQKQGATLDNFFVTTPVCCPSRATILTGLYPHNIHSTDGEGCMHMNVTGEDFVGAMMGKWLQKAGYATGQFGKLLNNMKPYCSENNAQILPGFDYYLTMCNYGRYFENTFSRNGQLMMTGKKPSDYLTSVLGNASIDWMKSVLEGDRPLFAYIAPHAPHVPATPAPWYKDSYSDMKAPRTPNYNYSALDHHFVIRQQRPINVNKEEGEIDELFRNRWRSLLSVDDLVVGVMKLLEEKGELNNTYVMLTSDHGYQLGQFRLPMCKLQVYEHDIRVPFIIRGPGIAASSHFKGVAGNVDIAPTIMELAGADIPPFMNDRSFVKQIVQTGNEKQKEPWRDMYMIEYWSLGNVTRMDHLVHGVNDTYLGARLLNSTHNYVYAEYYPDTTQLDFGEPVEYEFYNLDGDPWQLKNSYSTAEGSDRALIEEMRKFVHQEYGCIGRNCPQ